jgi:hypothetical protein
MFRPDAGTLSAELAEYILEVDFPAEDHAVYEQLSAKAQDGTLRACDFFDFSDFSRAFSDKSRYKLPHE